MTENPITMRPDGDYLAAIAIMRAGKLRRLPVVEADGRLVGIISISTLQSIQSTDAPKEQAIQADGVLVRVGELMTREVITVSPDYPLEEAAGLMIRHRIGSLPVVEDGKVVGIITDTDIFRVLVQVLGAGSSTIRVSVEVDNKPGQFAELTRRVASVGGNILSIASLPAESENRVKLTMRIADAPLDNLLEQIETHPNITIDNVWEIAS
jgi:acetoin utilization protein AcuB